MPKGFHWSDQSFEAGVKSEGNGTQSSTTGQKWDFEGHLLASGAVNAQGQWSGAKTTYTYDASGMRLSQASWNAAGVVTDGTSYVWDGDRVAEERDEKGVLQAVYEHGQELGPLRLTRRAGTVAAPVEQERYFIGDGQDSTRQLLDETGAVKDSYFYDAFGVSLPGGQGATENSFKYTGQQQDASGLYYLRARYYNAGTGRFLSHDPVMGHSDDPISMHRYLYAGADPVNGVDPTGRETLGSTLNNIGIAFNLASATMNMHAAMGYAMSGDSVNATKYQMWAMVDLLSAFTGGFGRPLTGATAVGGGFMAIIGVVSQAEAKLNQIYAVSNLVMRLLMAVGNSGGFSGPASSSSAPGSRPGAADPMPDGEIQDNIRSLDNPPHTNPLQINGSLLEAHIARLIERMNMLKSVGRRVFDRQGTLIGELDAQTEGAIIEVTAGNGGDKVRQTYDYVTNSTLNPNGKTVILYGPAVTPAVERLLHPDVILVKDDVSLEMVLRFIERERYR